ncbi:MAG: hypothetical protein K2X81_20150 [Candidatus Obscuribacterales bacterium]|nr:hypothetical protein [Candidatus Obscuribacterales bacterium]
MHISNNMDLTQVPNVIMLVNINVFKYADICKGCHLFQMFQENPKQIITTDLAIDDLLINEMSELPCVTYLNDVQLSDGLLSGDISATMLFACSDMGVQLPYVCSSEIAKLFIFQTFGHQFSTEARIIMCKGISDVIVYGHSNCELLKFLAKSRHTKEEEALISKYFSAEHTAQKKYLAKEFVADKHTQWLESCRTNILSKIKSMRSCPEIAELASKGSLFFHAWLLRSQDNTLEIFDPASKAFVSAHTDLTGHNSLTVDSSGAKP